MLRTNLCIDREGKIVRVTGMVKFKAIITLSVAHGSSHAATEGTVQNDYCFHTEKMHHTQNYLASLRCLTNHAGIIEKRTQSIT